MSDIEDGSLLYDAEFVNKFFELHSYAEAADWINTWYRQKGNNITNFTQDLPVIIDKALDYRDELLTKNPE